MTITPALPPPQNWQDFEELALEVFRVAMAAPTAERHGRTGQAQAGVDIFGIPQGQGAHWGVQCKQHAQHGADGRLLAGGLMTPSEIDIEIGKAESFNPTIRHLIFATTGNRDAKVQEHVRDLDVRRRRAGRFSVSCWFWEDIAAIIWRNHSLFSGFYQRFMPVNREATDRWLLALLQEACSREAFLVPVYSETGVEAFEQALQDTQTAFATGVLRDRLSRIVLRQAPYGYNGVENQEWKRHLRRAHADVRAAREAFENGARAGVIVQGVYMLEIRDHAVAAVINSRRAEAINALNQALQGAGLDPLPNPLAEQRT